MKKLLSIIIGISMLCILFVFPVSAESTDASDNEGRVFFTMEGLEAFDESIVVRFTDSSGHDLEHEFQPEKDSVHEIKVPFGRYSVNASVPDDSEQQYFITVLTPDITVSSADCEVIISVTRNPYYAEDGVEEDPIESSEPASNDTSEETDTNETVSSVDEDDDSKETTASPDASAPSSGEGEGEEEFDALEFLGLKESFSWRNTIISILGTAAFCGIAFLAAYLYRKYGTSF